MLRTASKFLDNLIKQVRNLKVNLAAIRPGKRNHSQSNVIRIIVEEHEDGFVGYPLGLKGVVVGQGDTKDEALEDTISAIKFHIETFGADVLKNESPVLNAYVAEVNQPELALS